jgi:hypothetical protein
MKEQRRPEVVPEDPTCPDGETMYLIFDGRRIANAANLEHYTL